MKKGRVLTGLSSQPSTALYALASWPFQEVGNSHNPPRGRTPGSLLLEAGQGYGCAEAGNSVLYSSWKVRSLNLRTARAAVRLCQERAGVRPAGKSWEGQRCQQRSRLQWAREHLSVRLSDPPLIVQMSIHPLLCEPHPHLRVHCSQTPPCRAEWTPIPEHLLWSEIPGVTWFFLPRLEDTEIWSDHGWPAGA